MQLVTYRASVEAEARLGAIINDLVLDLARFGETRGVNLPSTMLEFIDLGPTAVSAVTALISSAKGVFPIGSAVPLSNVKLLAPIPRPRKNIFGIGLNYTEHVAESAKSRTSQSCTMRKSRNSSIGKSNWQRSSAREPRVSHATKRSTTCLAIRSAST